MLPFFDLDHVNYYPNLIFTFVWSVIANMNQYNMFQSISLWCATQSPTRKHVESICKTFRYVSVTEICKKTWIKLRGLFWTNCDLTRSKHELLYMHCCYHRLCWWALVYNIDLNSFNEINFSLHILYNY